MSDSIKVTVSKNIKAYRKEKGLSQESLARKCNLSLRFVSRSENDPQNLTLESLNTIATALGVDIVDLVQDRSKQLPRQNKKSAHALDQAIKVLQSYRSLL